MHEDRRGVRSRCKMLRQRPSSPPPSGLPVTDRGTLLTCTASAPVTTRVRDPGDARAAGPFAHLLLLVVPSSSCAPLAMGPTSKPFSSGTASALLCGAVTAACDCGLEHMPPMVRLAFFALPPGPPQFACVRSSVPRCCTASVTKEVCPYLHGGVAIRGGICERHL